MKPVPPMFLRVDTLISVCLSCILQPIVQVQHYLAMPKQSVNVSRACDTCRKRLANVSGLWSVQLIAQEEAV